MPATRDEYTDRADVSETFADHCENVVFDGQALRVELGVTRYGKPAGGKPSAQRVTASRLVLTPQASLQLYNQLAQIVNVLEKKGIVTKRQVEGTKQ